MVKMKAPENRGFREHWERVGKAKTDYGTEGQPPVRKLIDQSPKVDLTRPRRRIGSSDLMDDNNAPIH